MNKTIRSLVAVAVMAVSAVTWAAKVDGAPSAPCEGLRVASGPAGKGYSKLVRDMKRVAEGTLNVCEVNTEGGLDNLTTLSTKGADLGIVPVDALKQMATGDDNIAGLKIVATLNSNYLHIVTRADGYLMQGERKWGGLREGDKKQVRFTKLSELRGAPVALVGSTQLLVRQLDKTLGLGLQYIDVGTDKEAFDMVTQGKAFAAFSIAGWPHGPINALKQNSNLTLVMFDMPINGPYGVRPLTYKGLGVYNVQALSVQNVLVTRPFSGAEKIGEVATLKSILASSLTKLQDGDFEPGWNEIKSLDGNVDWAKFNAPGAVTKRK